MENPERDESENTQILVVDDDAIIRKMLSTVINDAGFECLTAGSAEDAIHLLEHETPDVVVTDIVLPGASGIELMEKVRERQDAHIIVMTGNIEDFSYEEMIGKGASDFIQKPLSMRELMLRLRRVVRERRLVAEWNQATDKLQESYEKLKSILEQTVDALTSAVEIKDPYTSGHQRRVARIACAIAREMQLGEEQISGIRIASLLHDIGKIAIPSDILNKPGKLIQAEFLLLENHPRTGFEILKGIDFPWPVAQAVLQHHERMDGSGYPLRVSGENILPEARIIAVADVIEAMASHRPYRPALGLDAALDEVIRNKGNLYDPEVVGICMSLYRENKEVFEWA
jgi:putative nucleotidyltransferase with HDIG domain